MIAFTIALAMLIGLSLGLLGSGGSIVTLPVLVYIARIPAHQAVGMSLVIVGATSAIGSFFQIGQGNFHIRATFLFALTGMVGAFIGGKFTHLVSGPILLILFGGLMVIVGIRMLRTTRLVIQERKCKPFKCLAVGFAVGVLTGFLGVGGGFLILPALVFFAGLQMKPAIGTSLTIIAVNSFAGVISQLQHINFNWRVTGIFIAAAAGGMILGTLFAARFSAGRLQRAFAVSVLLLGSGLIVRNLILIFQ